MHPVIWLVAAELLVLTSCRPLVKLPTENQSNGAREARVVSSLAPILNSTRQGRVTHVFVDSTLLADVSGLSSMGISVLREQLVPGISMASSLSNIACNTKDREVCVTASLPTIIDSGTSVVVRLETSAVGGCSSYGATFTIQFESGRLVGMVRTEEDFGDCGTRPPAKRDTAGTNSLLENALLTDSQYSASNASPCFLGSSQ
jgi:hypothetical protein